MNKVYLIYTVLIYLFIVCYIEPYKHPTWSDSPSNFSLHLVCKFCRSAFKFRLWPHGIISFCFIMLSVVLQLSFIISQATKLWLIKFLLLLLHLLFLFPSVLFCTVLWPKVICMKSASEFYLMRRTAQLQGRKLTPREDWDNWIHWLVRGGWGEQKGGTLSRIVVLSAL